MVGLGFGAAYRLRFAPRPAAGEGTPVASEVNRGACLRALMDDPSLVRKALNATRTHTVHLNPTGDPQKDEFFLLTDEAGSDVMDATGYLQAIGKSLALIAAGNTEAANANMNQENALLIKKAEHVSPVVVEYESVDGVPRLVSVQAPSAARPRDVVPEVQLAPSAPEAVPAPSQPPPKRISRRTFHWAATAQNMLRALRSHLTLHRERIHPVGK